MTTVILSDLVVAAGTYDGVLAGWELKKKKGLELIFATGVHSGSIRSLSIATSPKGDEPGSLLSCGYDETLRTHDWHKRLTSSGEVRTPSDFGTPVCSSFAPPKEQSTHCIVGFTSGKICIYKKRDWSIQHVLAGHEGGVASLAVHPTGKLALSGGVTDGKLKLWDLTKGRLAFVNKTNPSSTFGGKSRYDPISSLVWSSDGDFYAFSYGSHITARDASSGKDVLDVGLPSRVNQVTIMTGPEGVFVAAACNDGSLPVLAVEDNDDENRRAIMAIEPVGSHLAGEERLKCIQCIRGYYVVTANSAGVVSIMNLNGAVKMIMSERDEEDNDDDSSVEETNVSGYDKEEMELAVDIVENIQLGTGARITCLTAWCRNDDTDTDENDDDDEAVQPAVAVDAENTIGVQTEQNSSKRKEVGRDVTMDSVAIKKARTLVEKAKKLKKRRDKKKKQKIPSNEK